MTGVPPSSRPPPPLALLVQSLRQWEQHLADAIALQDWRTVEHCRRNFQQAIRIFEHLAAQEAAQPEHPDRQPGQAPPG